MTELYFSIIVPVYNVERYVEEAVYSAASQSANDFEIILVDDGSTDNSGVICDRLKTGYDNILVIHKENGGLSDARNVGIENAKGKYIVFLDSDDLLAENALNNLKKFIEKNGDPEIIVSRRASFRDGEPGDFRECSYRFDEDLMRRFTRAEQYEELQKYNDCWLGAWVFAVNTQFILSNKLLFYKGILHEDEEWVPRLFFSDGAIAYNNSLLYCNRIERPGSITATRNIKRQTDILKIISLLEKFKNTGQDPDVQKCILKRQQSLFFGVISQTYEYKAAEGYDFLIKEIRSKKNILNNSQKFPHRVAKVLISLIGIENTSYVLSRLLSKKQ